jgi:hypothetical protein
MVYLVQIENDYVHVMNLICIVIKFYAPTIGEYVCRP